MVKALGTCIINSEAAVKLLEHRFQDHLIINAGGVQDVAEYARILRLAVNTEECHVALDYIANKALVGISIENMETAINELFPDRFIEPEE